MIMTPKTWIAAVAVIASMTIAPVAHADGKNEVRAVTFDEDSGTTRVHVRGAQTPTFTVYKLERPMRVVIDLPQARLADVLRGHESAAVFTPSTWAVSTIAAQQLDDNAVRVIITMARPGRYDVKTDGNEVIVMVMPRDPAPKTTSPEELAKVQAESDRMKKLASDAEHARDAAQQQADTANATLKQSRAEADAAKAEAERLRRTAAEQSVKAEAAQRAVEQARQLQQKNAATAADLERVKAVAAQAKQDAEQAKTAAATAQAEADRTRLAAVAEAARAKAEAAKARDEMQKMQVEADRAKSDAATRMVEADRVKSDAAKRMAEADRAKSDADRAKTDADRAKSVAAKQTVEADRAKAEADRVKAEAAKKAADAEAALAKQRAETEHAKRDAAYAMTAADQARRDAEQAKRDASRTQAEQARDRAQLEAAKREAAKRVAEVEAAMRETAKREAEVEAAKHEAAKRVAEADAAKDAAKGDLAKTRAEADAARTEATTTAAKAKDDVARAQREAAAAKAEAARARSEAESARAEAEAARTAAAADKKQAEADKHKAEVARGEAEKLMSDAKQQLATLDKKSTAAQQLEDKARAANAAAQAREEAARDAESKAKQERTAAELAAKDAQNVRDRAAASDRAKAQAEAKAAEERLAMARKATEEAQSLRAAAEQAAKDAKRDLEATKSTLAGVEQQRTQAIAAATEAARKRGDAEAAASDAARRRSEAELAATEAAKKRHEAEVAASDAAQRKTTAERDRAEAEAQRQAALDAAKSAQIAKDAAEKQRKIAETAARAANAAKSDAETSLAALTAKRSAAERAAAELETRSKAEAKAQAEVLAAQARKANDSSQKAQVEREQALADARAELEKLAADRKRAETELADRRKAVALQQAEASRLETAATQAHDAANREELRRAELAKKRTAEESELAKLEAAKAEAKLVKAQVRVAQVDPMPAPAPAPMAKPAPTPVAKPVATPPVAAKLTKVTAINFKGDDGNGQVDITVGDGAVITIGEVTNSHVELIVDNAELGAKLERTLDVSKFGSPVRSVSSFRDRRTPNRVRLIAELAQAATPTVERDDHSVRWHFISGDIIAKRPVHTKDVPSPIVGGFGAASTPVAQQTVTQLPPQGGRKRIYHGATVDFDFKDAPIHDLLRVIADTGHISIVVPQTIDAKVTVRLKRVPWDQALEVILSSYGLWYRRDGSIYRVAPRKELDAEDEAENARREAAIKAEAPRPEVVHLNYASADELKPKLEPMLSAKGKIETDPRTNALIVNDVAGNRAEIVRLALSLDTQTPQITIEARVVEARSTFLRQLGVQWGGNATAGANGGNATGLIWPSSIGIKGGNEDQSTNRTGVSTPSDFAVNLPASTGTGEGGVLGMALGSVGGNFNINLRLSALEDSGTVRIISAPKITVLNNREAKISQGVSIPISVVSAAGTNTQFVQADLALTVKPYVSQSDCAIAMDLVVTKNEPDFVNVGARGDPTILRKEARTYMLVSDGETAVLGGIYTRNTGLAYKKVPFFGDLPVLGWLFKNRRENDDRTEILVFITPKITNKATLPCVK